MGKVGLLSFKDTIIMTSMQGTGKAEANEAGAARESRTSPILGERTASPEFANRFDSIIEFKALI